MISNLKFQISNSFDMARSKIITGLDIGTNTIKCLVIQKKGPEWEVLSYSQIPSFGLRRGAVVNVEDTVRNIQILMSKVEKDCGKIERGRQD